MSSDLVVQTDHLSKCYKLYSHPKDRLKQFLVPRLQQMVGQIPSRYYHEVWALRDISMEIRRGETIGIIGRNGSGKSTLLQLLYGIVAPTSGTVEVNGRVSGILELGAGFHPEFTGRENVYLYGSLLGFSRSEMERRFVEIARFADIGEHIDRAVKTYSSGMYVRLAFAVAVCADADVLIVDEALAVGDIKFQQQCMRHLAKCQAMGTTVILVSHDPGILKTLCRRVYCIEGGVIVDSGTAGQVVDRYVLRSAVDSLTSINSTVLTGHNVPSDDFATPYFERSGSGQVRVTSARLMDSKGHKLTTARFGESARLAVTIKATFACPRLTVAFYVKDRARLEIIGTNSDYENAPVFNVKEGDCYKYEFSFALRLRQGNYSVTVILANGPDAVEYYDWIEDAVSFEVLSAEQPIYAMYAPEIEAKVDGPRSQMTG